MQDGRRRLVPLDGEAVHEMQQDIHDVRGVGHNDEHGWRAKVESGHRLAHIDLFHLFVLGQQPPKAVGRLAQERATVRVEEYVVGGEEHEVGVLHVALAEVETRRDGDERVVADVGWGHGRDGGGRHAGGGHGGSELCIQALASAYRQGVSVLTMSDIVRGAGCWVWYARPLCL